MSSLQIHVRISKADALAPRWYSARLRFAILTDRAGLERFFDSVILLRAGSRPVAFERALALGRERQQSYRNQQGVAVRWRLASVVSLDEIPERDLNGAELMGIPVEPAGSHAPLGWDHEFRPELSQPTETRA